MVRSCGCVQNQHTRGRESFRASRRWRLYHDHMPRRLRFGSGGFVYHVLNRAVGRPTLFHKVGDYAAFLEVLAQAQDFVALRLLAYCLMPNHWHLVLWPQEGGHARKSRAGNCERLPSPFVSLWSVFSPEMPRITSFCVIFGPFLPKTAWIWCWI
jgi:hypothetical protein